MASQRNYAATQRKPEKWRKPVIFLESAKIPKEAEAKETGKGLLRANLETNLGRERHNPAHNL
jgi:hypothetical protein